MRKIIFVLIVLFASCKKEPTQPIPERETEFKYRWIAFHLSQGAEMNIRKSDFHGVFNDTIAFNNNSMVSVQHFNKEVCPRTITVGIQLLNDTNPTDSVMCQLWIDGVMKAQSPTVGRNQNYNAEIQFNYTW